MGLIVMGLMLVSLPPKDLPALGFGFGTMAIYGDSIVSQMANYQAGLSPPINTAGNGGVSGQTAMEICSRVTGANGYSHIMVEGGINDFILELPPQGIIDAYTLLLEALEHTGQQVRIIGVTRVDPGALSPAYQFLNNAAIDAVNDRLIDLCATYDNCRPMEGAMRMSVVGHTTDGIHKSGGGYAAWAAELVAGL